jgi:hypothetical protein
MSAHLVSALVRHECALGIREPSCVPRASKTFFILVAHDPLRVVGHMVAPELSPRGGRVRSHEVRGSVGVLPCREAGSEAEGMW